MKIIGLAITGMVMLAVAWALMLLCVEWWETPAKGMAYWYMVLSNIFFGGGIVLLAVSLGLYISYATGWKPV